MKKENYEKLKPYLDELDKFIACGYYSSFTNEKVELYKKIYKDETGSCEYEKSLTCTRCKLNLATDIYNLIVKHEEVKPKTKKK